LVTGCTERAGAAHARLANAHRARVAIRVALCVVATLRSAARLAAQATGLAELVAAEAGLARILGAVARIYTGDVRKFGTTRDLRTTALGDRAKFFGTTRSVVR